MKKAKGEDGSNTMDRISDLPQGILHRILYFLSQEEAVRTSVLSKSWRYIWCTRPNLDFSDRTVKGNKQEFMSILKTSLQRYRHQKLCLEEFCLSMSLQDYLYGSKYGKSLSFLEKWIPRLTKMGVKESRLSIFSNFLGRAQLPPVVFGYESLQDLHLEGFELDKKAIRKIVPFNHLKKLRLQQVSVEDEIFEKIISCCPLIESMHVEGCVGLKTIKVNDLHNLKYFYFEMHGDLTAMERYCSIKLCGPSLETIDISYGNILFHEGADFPNLKRLNLEGVKSSIDHMSLCTFPSLEWLGLHGCDGLKETQLLIDAPNIHYFEYEGDFVPSISFPTASSEWDSVVHLTHMSTNVGSSSFLKLKMLLKSLRQSKISLSITSSHYPDEDIIQENIEVQDIDGGDKTAVVVELLRFWCPLSSISSFLNGVFCTCRPRNIYHDCSWEMEVIECLWDILMQRESGDEDDQFGQFWGRDLEEVSLEITKTNGKEEWLTITLSELRSHEQSEHIIRFALKWRGTL